MKTLKKIGMAFVAILICLCYSCSSESEFPTTPTPEVPESPQESKMVTVKLNVKDIMSVQEELMESRTNVNDYNDLYMVDIVDVNNNNKTYALGMFDLSKDITVELPEDGKFWFRGVAVKDGKDKIYVTQDGRYALPFDGKFTNEFTTEIPENYEFSPLLYVLKGNSSQLTMIAKDLEVYTLYSDFDSSDPFIASDTNDEEIDFYSERISYIGTEFVAEDMKKGKLIVSFSAKGSDNNTYTSPEVEITAEDTPVFNTFSFGSVFNNAIYVLGVSIKLHMKWIKEDGSEVTLPNEQAYITVKNSYKYSIKINVGTTSKAAMNISEIETPTFSDYNTEHWNVEEGTASKK